MSLPAGDYAIMVEGYASLEGAFQLNVACGAPTTAAPTAAPSSAPTPTDPWTALYNAADGVACGDTPQGNTANDGTNIRGNPAKEVLYRITLAAADTLTVTTCGSSYDTYLRSDHYQHHRHRHRHHHYQ
jgi:hypothetical protein